MLLLVLIGGVAPVRADRALEVVDPRPVAVEGGILGVPVRCRTEAGSRTLPRSVRMLFEDGSETGALVVWVRGELEASAAGQPARWTRPLSGFRVVEAPSTREERESALAYALCPTPPGYRGSVRLGRETVEPRWLDAPDRVDGPLLACPEGPGWPVIGDPGSWWRWVLICDRLGLNVPVPPGDESERLLARHLAGLWQAGLARLHAESPGTASELLELLTARCRTESGREIAAWITDRTELQSLLELMLDTDRSDSLVVRSVLSFLDARFPVLPWIELETGSRVRIAIANPTDGEQVVRLQWLEGDPIPSAAVLPPGRVVEVELDRPARRPFRTVEELEAEPPSNDLVLNVGRHQRQLRFSSDRLEVRPPGLGFGPFTLPLTLPEAWAGRFRLPSAVSAAQAILRKRAGRWEVFLECHRPSGAPFEDDLVEIHLGPPDAPIRVIRIGEDGTLAFTPDAARFQGATARVRRFTDRWRALVTLEPELVDACGAPGEPGTLQVGFRRMAGDRLLSVAGSPVPPWSSAPASYLVDLSNWGEIPASQGSEGPGPEASVYLNP